MLYNNAKELLRKYLLGQVTADDEKKVDEWYDAVDDSADLYSPGNKQSEKIKEEIYQKIKARLEEKGLNPVTIGSKPAISFKRNNWLAAAVLTAAICSTAFFLFRKNHPLKKDIQESPLAKAKNDVKPPSGNKAILKLADGRLIQLDSSGVGTLAVQGSMQVTKLADGRITYNGEAGEKIVYNTLSVPRGSTPVKLVLGDGSEVWVNVASSITYPTAFAGRERKVEITGEAYFEITKNKEMPFVVKRMNDDAQVQVLGTHFNVNAYDDEASMKVTLLEGAIDVSKSGIHNVLKPGQQAMIENQMIKLINDVDLEEVMAWKNGRFYFEGADIKTIMRQIEKWYNIRVTYQSEIKYSFVAKISRDENASEILQILELTDMVHFKIEGDQITVTK
ncbi:MAG: FecR domain-containing protein [Ferruginibacter sp.]